MPGVFSDIFFDFFEKFSDSPLPYRKGCCFFDARNSRPGFRKAVSVVKYGKQDHSCSTGRIVNENFPSSQCPLISESSPSYEKRRLFPSPLLLMT